MTLLSYSKSTLTTAINYIAINYSLVRWVRVTYPGLKQVPRVVDSADSARPAAACTVQSHTRKKKDSKHSQPSHIQEKKNFKKKSSFIRGGGSRTCLRVLDSSVPQTPDGVETDAARAARDYSAGTQTRLWVPLGNGGATRNFLRLLITHVLRGDWMSACVGSSVCV